VTILIQLPRRIRALREMRKLTQEQVTQKLGFKDRQTLSKIEANARQVSAEELVRLAEVFDVDLDYFTDPFRLVGEGNFSWRQNNVEISSLLSFEEQAGRWIALYRHLVQMRSDKPSALLSRLPLTKHSSFKDAWYLGERVGEEFQLGEIPSATLRDAIEKRGTLVLHVDALAGISGAACQLPTLNAIIINRKESVGRRNYDLAHEFFHLLTWETMRPSHVEGSDPFQGDRVEQLADNFASALLMPHRLIDERWAHRKPSDLVGWLNTTATDLGVSAMALKWKANCCGC
jgi:transcriptional regulator with XRE-family HTH domain